jgi:hypothetical protein
MSSFWHLIGTAVHWLYAHLAALGISTVVTAIGGAAMWFLGFRKARLSNQKLALEIDHIKTETRKLELEVIKLTEESGERERARKLGNLKDRIIELAKEYIMMHPTMGAAPFSEQKLCSELNESHESIAKALNTLRDQGRARFESMAQTWIITV